MKTKPLPPLNEKGKKILKTMKKFYGAKNGEKIFYFCMIKQKIKDVEGKKKRKK